MSFSARSTIQPGRGKVDWAIDVAGSPDEALQCLASAINLPRRRALGVFKLGPEFVGWTSASEFEIWERRGRAVHAIGRAVERRGGTRLEAHLKVSPTARGLLWLFFPLYALVGVGLATQPPDPQLTPTDFVIVVAGAVVIATIFLDARRRQRRDLARFLDLVFRPPRAW